MSNEIIRNFFDLPLGTRFRYIGGSDVWVSIDRSGCGKIARYEPHDGWVAGQQICTFEDSEVAARTTQVEVIVAPVQEQGVNDDRTAFEAWMTGFYLTPDLIADENGSYSNFDVLGRWIAWQARASIAAPVAQPAAPVPVADLTDERIRTLWQQSWEVAIKDAGFCIGNGDVAHMNQPIVFARTILAAARSQS